MDIEFLTAKKEIVKYILIEEPGKLSQDLERKYNRISIDKFANLYPSCMSSKVFLYEDGRVAVFFPHGIELFSSQLDFNKYLINSSVRSHKKKIIESLPQNIIYYVADGIKVSFRKLDFDHGRALLSYYPVKKNNSVLESYFFEISDFNVFVAEPSLGNYFIFNSIDEYYSINSFNEMLRSAGAEKIGFEEFEMNGLNPFGKDFMTSQKSNLNKLADLLNLDIGHLDFSKKSLSLVEQRFKEKIFSYWLKDFSFIPLLYYIGETYIRNENGEWALRYDAKFNNHVPDILYDKKFKYLYRGLLDFFNPNDDMWISLDVIYRSLFKP